MIEFLKRLFGQQGSSVTAKERLRLVLMTDHLELAPEMIEAMKHDLVDVISRYVEVDRDRIEVNFEQQDRALAMLANIPILSVNRPTNGTKKESGDKGDPSALPTATGVPEVQSASGCAAAPNVASPGAQAATESIVVRRRRRKRRNQPVGAGPNPAPAH